MKRKLFLGLVLMLFVLGIFSCTTLSSLSETEFADATNQNTSDTDDDGNTDLSPLLLISMPSNNQTITGTKYVVSGSVVGFANIQHIFVFVQATNGGDVCQYATIMNDNGYISFSCTVTNVGYQAYYVWAHAMDADGRFVYVEKRLIKFDSGSADYDAPVIYIGSPTDGSTGLAGTLIVSGTAVDASGTSQVFVKIGAVQKTASGTGNWQTSFALGADTYQIVAWGRDIYDNIGGYVTNTVTLTNSTAGAPTNVVYYGGTVISGTSYTNDFGTTGVGGSIGPRTFTISNAGTADLSIGGVNVSAPFGYSPSINTSLAPGEIVSFDVTFSPSAAGTETKAVSIQNSDSGTFTFYVKGNATNSTQQYPEIAVYYGSTPIADGNSYTNDFGTTLINNSVGPRTFTISNIGDGNLTVSSVVDSGTGEFTTTTILNATLAAGTATNFTVTYNAPAAGTNIVMVSIANDDSDENPYTFYIKGVTTNATGGVSNEIAVSYSGTDITSGNVYTNDFGATMTNSSVQHTFRISNIGNSDLSVSSVADSGTGSGAFTTANVNTTVSGNGYTDFNITLDAITDGTNVAQVTINNSDTDEGTFVFYIKGIVTNALPVGAVETPLISPVRETGDSAETQPENATFTITCGTTGSSIYWTTNGVDPTESDNLYTSVVGVGHTVEIRAKAFKSGQTASAVDTEYLDKTVCKITANAEFGNSIYVKGTNTGTPISGWSWADGDGKEAMWTTGNVWVLVSWQVTHGETLTFKAVRDTTGGDDGDALWDTGSNHDVIAGSVEAYTSPRWPYP